MVSLQLSFLAPSHSYPSLSVLIKTIHSPLNILSFTSSTSIQGIPSALKASSPFLHVQTILSPLSYSSNATFSINPSMVKLPPLLQARTTIFNFSFVTFIPFYLFVKLTITAHSSLLVISSV